MTKMDEEQIKNFSARVIVPNVEVTPNSVLLPNAVRVTVITQNTSKSNVVKVTATSQWSRIPFIQRKDILAVSWGNGHAFSGNRAVATNRIASTMANFPKLHDAVPNTGLAYSVNISAMYSPKNPGITNYVQKLTVTTNLTINKKGTTNVVAKYGHTTIKIGSISVSISPKGIGTPSISFGKGVEEFVAYTSFTK